MLEQVEKGKPGIQITPIIMGEKVYPSLTFQNKKKDFRLVINKFEGGYVGFEKTWRF
jgi:hypothetical protein